MNPVDDADGTYEPVMPFVITSLSRRWHPPPGEGGEQIVLEGREGESRTEAIPVQEGRPIPWLRTARRLQQMSESLVLGLVQSHLVCRWCVP